MQSRDKSRDLPVEVASAAVVVTGPVVIATVVVGSSGVVTEIATA